MKRIEYLRNMVHPEFQDEFFRRLGKKGKWSKWEVRAEFLRAREVFLLTMLERGMLKKEIRKEHGLREGLR